MKRFIYCMVAMLVTFSVYAQTTLPGKCLVAKPNCLIGKDGPIKEKAIQTFSKDSQWGQSDKSDKPWDVYSDRENNVTYNKPDKASGRFATLNFNEKLRIAKIQNGYALVYKEEKEDATDLKINKGVTRGWVPMSHLLL